MAKESRYAFDLVQRRLLRITTTKTRAFPRVDASPWMILTTPRTYLKDSDTSRLYMHFAILRLNIGYIEEIVLGTFKSAFSFVWGSFAFTFAVASFVLYPSTQGYATTSLSVLLASVTGNSIRNSFYIVLKTRFDNIIVFYAFPVVAFFGPTL